MTKKYLLLCWLIGFTALSIFAQKKKKIAIAPSAPEVVKRPLNHTDYDSWKSITQRAISPDGTWAAYVISAQDGDGSLVVQSLRDERKQQIERGSEVRLSFDSEFAVFKVKPTTQATKDAKRAKKKKEELPKDSLGIYGLKINQLVKIPNVQSYKIPEKAGGMLSYLTDSPPPAKPAAKDTTKKIAEPPKSKKTPKKESEDNGYKLVYRNLKTNVEQPFGFVKEYEFTKNGHYLAFVSTGNDSTMKPGVYVWDSEKSALTTIYEGRNKQKFNKLSFDESGNQLAFVADLDTNAKAQIRSPKVFYWKTGETKASILADDISGFAPKNWYISAEYTPSFAKDGSKLFFGTNPKPFVQDTTLLPEEIVNVEVWNHKDSRLQTQQKVSLEQDKKKSYLAVVQLDNRQTVQLATPDLATIDLINEGRSEWVLASTNQPYSNQHWDWNPKEDAYLLNTRTGTKTLIKRKIEGSSQVSPEGKYVYWFSNPDTAWVAYNTTTAQMAQITNNKTVKFADEDDDHPDFPNAYGVAGWSKGDERILIYDKYDIWSVNPDNGQMQNLTQTGRSQKKTYRYVRLDPEERSIDTSQPLTLRMFDNTSKGSGIAQLVGNQLTELYSCNCTVSPQISKAKNSSDVLMSRSSFREFPELWQSDLTFKNVRKMSDIGTQMDKFNWGSVELVDYKATDGTPLQGLLYKPDGFDATKKYPMLVYFYEKNSDNLHNFINPTPSGSAYTNYTYSVSNGYLVFVPDIVYQIGYPGPSAFNCVMPGVLSVLDKGFVNRERIGIVGHSWGGYQAAYIITKTNLFRTAVPGAPVVNMTSAYSGVRWGTGLSRQAQYEFNQSRIGGNIWQKPMNFLDNSPLFYLDKVQTPTLILHNDDDDAVPWYQGIEMFMGLKRLGKPTWMLVYNGEKHGNRQRKNQKDFTVRMWQYLDFYLKDSPAPSWMTDGLPMVEKGINQHLETNK